MNPIIKLKTIIFVEGNYEKKLYTEVIETSQMLYKKGHFFF